MKRIFGFFVKYYFFWLIYFLFFKLFFLVFNHEKTSGLAWSEIFGVFRHGLVMDLSAAGYTTLFAGLVLALSAVIKFRFVEKIIRYYTVLLLILLTAAGLMDSALYAPWGVRLNTQILPYLENPGGMWASLDWWQWLLALLVEIVICSVFYKRYLRIIPYTGNNQRVEKWYVAPVIIFFTAVLIIPIRGGFDRAPLNYSSVYFSESRYANHAAYNYFWSFAYALSHNKATSNPVHYMSQEKCDEIVKNSFSPAEEEIPVYLKSRNGKAINVVMVILESFSAKVIESLGGKAGLTPNLNRYCREGISFNNFYATGLRSDRGISALLASYPALVKASAIANFPQKLDSLDYLPRYFRNRGYKTSFYYGGDVDFYNLRMMLMKAGVEQIISKSDFPAKQNKQKWGVSDEYLFERVAGDFLGKTEAFFGMVYTVSSHEPFDIPDSFQRIKGNSNEDKYLNAMAYADSCLGVFIEKIRQSPQWDNTLVIITSDHATLLPEPTRVDEPASFRLPLIWTGGVVDSAMQVETIGSQTDFGTTLVQQMGWKTVPSVFAKNLFGSRSYAFFYNIDGWGYVAPETGFFVDTESNNMQFYYGENRAETPLEVERAKAYTQYLHEDFLKR
ncbi:MAG: LTA synthase family protein [Prevotellaceae bacterium]|jgi:phosphoglycerol transferase MdoB-like AlkP superfamily enzyme|nr:LTA synthase family protein [Prevotellaceae bacterium]